MNFLPEEEKILLKKEYLRRVLVVAGIFVFISVFLNITLLAPLFLNFKIQENELKKRLDLSQKNLSAIDSKETTSFIKEINEKISILDFSNIPTKSELVKKIISLKPEPVRLNNISISQTDVIIKGKADRRTDFVNFVDSLKMEKTFQKVDSPVSNLVKEKDIEFSLTISL